MLTGAVYGEGPNVPLFGDGGDEVEVLVFGRLVHLAKGVLAEIGGTPRGVEAEPGDFAFPCEDEGTRASLPGSLDVTEGRSVH